MDRAELSVLALADGSLCSSRLFSTRESDRHKRVQRSLFITRLGNNSVEGSIDGICSLLKLLARRRAKEIMMITPIQRTLCLFFFFFD